MKNPLLDAFQAPMSMMPATKFMQLLQQQQVDNIETSVKAISCRDPMSLLSLQQSYMQRMIERWSQFAAATPAAKAAAPKAAAKVEDKLQPMATPAKAPAAPAKPKVTPVAAVVYDDLTVIKGIGPKFAQTLNEHGITSYGQLASLSAKEIEELEAKLGFSGRFEREGWVEQARALASH